MGAAADIVLKAFALGDAQDLEGIMALRTEDADFVMPGMSVAPEQMEMFYRATWGGFPDGKHTIENVIETDDAVVIEATWRGTNTGPSPMPNGEMMPPTGRTVSFRLGAINRVRDGRVCSTHVYMDQMEFLRGLGVIPDAPQDA